MRALPIVIAEKRSRRSGSDGKRLSECSRERLWMQLTAEALKLWFYAGSSDGSLSGSDDSPKGPKGGGTLKTCAVCLEDYK